MKYIVNFSGGLCSFWASHRTIQKHGKQNVINLFADVLIESATLYSFNEHSAELLGIPIIRVSREMKPWQLFRKEKMIGNNRFPICSTKLKREPLNEWMEGNFEMRHGQTNAFFEDATCVLGFDWTESHRVKEMRDAHPDWRIEAPMSECGASYPEKDWGPIWDKCRMEKEAMKLGLVIDPTYKQGFPHNNCGKRCVRAGKAHWAHLYEVDRPAFMEWAIEERATIIELKGKDVDALTILKETRGGIVRSVSLMELADRIESGEDFSRSDWGGCGCGGAAE